MFQKYLLHPTLSPQRAPDTWSPARVDKHVGLLFNWNAAGFEPTLSRNQLLEHLIQLSAKGHFFWPD